MQTLTETLDYELDEGQRDFLASFRRFLEVEIEPSVLDIEKTGIARSHFAALGRFGYNGLLHEERFGGSNADHVTTMLAEIELAAVCGSTFFSVGASAGLYGIPLRFHGTEAQKERLLPALIKGELIGCLSVTEPQAGSDVQAIESAAVNHNGTILLKGRKTYITNAPMADRSLVLARYHDGNRDRGLTLFDVDLNAEGVHRSRPFEKMGLRGSKTGELTFDDVSLTEDSIVGTPGRGFLAVMQVFDVERLSMAAYATGVMRSCLEDSLAFSRSRKAFGKPLYKHQSVAFMLADMKTELDATMLYLLETAYLFDRAGGKSRLIHNGAVVDLSARASALKIQASEAGRKVANLAVQIHGGAGYMEEYRVCRLYRDVRLAEIGGGTTEIQKQIVARAEAKRVS